MARLGKLTIKPVNPVLNSESTRENGSSRICGNGSHAVPNCCNPGLRESISSLDLTKWEIESL